MTEDVAGEARGDDRRHGGLWQVAAIGVLVIIIVLVFLILWDPFRGDRQASDSGRRPGLVGSIEALPASGEYIALWIKPGQDVGGILRRHGLDSDSVLFQREVEGYYIVDVAGADADALVSALKGDDALYDAGRVYEEEPSASP